MLGLLLFLLSINDVSNDVIIYISAPTSDELQKKLQLCVDNVHHWYHMNRLTINKKKSAFMFIGSKAQLQSLKLDQFSINLDSNQITDSQYGDVQLREILTECKEFQIPVQGLFVRIMIILTQEG